MTADLGLTSASFHVTLKGMRRLVFAFYLSFASCSSLDLSKDRSPNSTGSEAPIFDPTILQDWDRNIKMPCETPYRVTYRKGGRTLIYYAIRYGKIPIAIEDPALTGIREEILRFKPDEIVVNITELNLADAGGGRDAFDLCLRSEKFFCGEPLYASHIAYLNSIHVNAGEISPAQLQTVLESEGAMSRKDAMAYTSAQVVIGFKLRDLPQDKWRAEFERNRVKNPAHSRVNLWSYDEFESWVQLRMRSFAQLKDIENSWIEPRTDRDASPLHRISAIATRARDRFLLKTVQDSLNRATTVLMVYSIGHQRSLDAAFTKALGSPTIECLK